MNGPRAAKSPPPFPFLVLPSDLRRFFFFFFFRFTFCSTGKWYTSVEQPHDEIHLAIGGQDHQPVKAEVTKTYDKFGDLAKSTKTMSAQVRACG